MSKKLVVCDFGIPEFLNNAIFQKKVAEGFPGGSIWPLFAEKLRALDIDCITGDVFLRDKPFSQEALCISDMSTERTTEILKKNSVPLIVLSGESPNVGWRFYKNVRTLSDHYKHAIFFGGFEKEVSPRTKFHKYFWPNRVLKTAREIPWKDRKFLVMVASNKLREEVSYEKPFVSLRRAGKKIYWKFLKIKDPMFDFEDLYRKRIAAINFFQEINGFDLFGRQWDELSKLDKKTRKSVERLRPKIIENKFTVIPQYKFSLCFENCVFPGYITEKLFDCFFSSCIPIYLGAPDVVNFIPSNAFVDFRNFEDFRHLADFLHGMSEEKGLEYLEAAKDFLTSSEFKKFTDIEMVSHMMGCVTDELGMS